jgi:CheY-like chemotaxis protein
VPVLVVDDHATNRLSLCEMLAGWGLVPQAVENGFEALALLESAPGGTSAPRLIVLDGVMPGMNGIALARRIRAQEGYGNVPLIMLVPAGRGDDLDRAGEALVDRRLTKPLKPSDLLDAVVSVLGAAPAVEATPAADHTRRAPRELRVLLAEDGVVNQRVVVDLLRARGHDVTAVGTGHEALAALERSTFDVVLMDVQMPEMDGLAATAAIRAKEEGSAAHVPIVALTASALREDQERCLAAGMDAYLAKPLRAAQLYTVVEGAARTRPAAQGSRSPAVSDIPIDADLVELVRRETGRLLQAIREATANRDARGLERATHALRGSMGTFGAADVIDATRRLEALAREGRLGEANTAVAALEQGLVRLEESLVRAEKGETGDRS